MIYYINNQKTAREHRLWLILQYVAFIIAASIALFMPGPA